MKNELFNILYVDDEYQNLVSFKACFRKFYNIFTANSAKEAIEFLRNNAIHLIITDQRMPELTGVEFFEQIKSLYPETIRMILTGFTDIDSIINAINTGRVFHYVTKPWNENELKLTIDNALHLHQLQQKNKQLLAELQKKVEEQEKMLNLFQKFVPAEVVKRAIDLQANSSLFDGEYRYVTVLFCDIRDFTALSEKVSPKEVVKILNKYYSSFSKIIKKYRGYVNQYVGDEIFAVFGAPAYHSTHEQCAVFCALEMVQVINGLSENFEPVLGRKIEIGIGINTGEVVAGNLGSEEKLEYSLTGDTVNTGKRIETLTKDRPNTILISQKTYETVMDRINAVEWEPMEVRGKTNKIIVYEVLGRNDMD